MKALKRLMLIVTAGLATAVTTAPSLALAKAKAKSAPVVVELFTAQGCSSCKAANRLVAAMADKPGLIVLTWSVDYWDYLGWKDTFARPEFTERQQAFARRLGPRDVYTPQVVVNGRAQISGDDAAGVRALIQASAPSRHARPPKIRFLPKGRIAVGSAQPGVGRSDVWLVRYDPREQDVEVKAGDNRGATVAHRNVVQEVLRLGSWRGHSVVFTAPKSSAPELATAVLVEAGHGGTILAAAQSKPGR